MGELNTAAAQQDKTRYRRLKRRRHGTTEIIVTVILCLFALFTIFPFIIPVLFAAKTQLEFAYHPWAWPKSFQVKNFIDAWKAVRIDKGLLNTLIVCIGSIACTIPPAALAGYIFARYKSRVTEVLFYLILIGYFIPVQMVLVPLYKMEVALKFNDTLYGLFLPMAAFGIPFWTLIYRSFFRSLPNELAEAARVDGAGHWVVLFRIMLPLAQPATVLAMLLVFIGAWNDYLLSLILLTNQNNFTMQLRVASFLNAYGTDRMPRYAAAAIISAAPTVILYIIGHRWIIRGTLAGAIKE
jgi:ABC-type glycerol-3-phosphate transport system permease component